MTYSQEDLQKMLSAAYSYESRDKHGKAGLQTEEIGTVDLGARLYDLFKDTGGNIWYKVRIRTEEGIVGEFEAIFGMSKEKLEKRRRYLESFCDK